MYCSADARSRPTYKEEGSRGRRRERVNTHLGSNVRVARVHVLQRRGEVQGPGPTGRGKEAKVGGGGRGGREGGSP